jgi:hypothetical protein
MPSQVSSSLQLVFAAAAFALKNSQTRRTIDFMIYPFYMARPEGRAVMHYKIIPSALATPAP